MAYSPEWSRQQEMHRQQQSEQHKSHKVDSSSQLPLTVVIHSSHSRSHSRSRSPHKPVSPSRHLSSLRTRLLESKLHYRDLKSSLRRARVQVSALERDLSRVREARLEARSKKHRDDMTLLSDLHLAAGSGINGATPSTAFTIEVAAAEAAFHERERQLDHRESVLKVELRREQEKSVKLQKAILELQASYARMKRKLVEGERRAQVERVEEALRKDEEEDEEKYPLPPPPLPSSHRSSTTLHESHDDAKSHRRGSIVQIVSSPSQSSAAQRHLTVTVSPMRHQREREREERQHRRQRRGGGGEKEIDEKERDEKSSYDRFINNKPVESAPSSSSAHRSESPSHETGIGVTLSRNTDPIDGTRHLHVTLTPRKYERRRDGGGTKKEHRSQSVHRHQSRDHPRARSRSCSTCSSSSSSSSRSSSSSSSYSSSRFCSPTRITIRATASGEGDDRKTSDDQHANGGSAGTGTRPDGRGGASPRRSSSILRRRTLPHGVPPLKKSAPVLPGAHRAFMEQTSSSLQRQRDAIELRKTIRPKVTATATTATSQPETSARTTKMSRPSSSSSSGAQKRSKSVAPTATSTATTASTSLRPSPNEHPITLKLEVEAEPAHVKHKTKTPRSKTPPPVPTRVTIVTPAPPPPPPSVHAHEVEQLRLELHRRLELDDQRRREIDELRAYRESLAQRQQLIDARRQQREKLRYEQAKAHATASSSSKCTRGASRSRSRSHSRSRSKSARRRDVPSPTSSVSSVTVTSPSSNGSLTPRTPVLPKSPVTPTGDSFAASPFPLDPFPSTSPAPLSTPSTTSHLLALHARREYEEQLREEERDRCHAEKKRLLAEYHQALTRHYERARERREAKEKRRRRQKKKELERAERQRAHDAELAKLAKLAKLDEERRRASLAQEEAMRQQLSREAQLWRTKFDRLVEHQRAKEDRAKERQRRAAVAAEIEAAANHAALVATHQAEAEMSAKLADLERRQRHELRKIERREKRRMAAAAAAAESGADKSSTMVRITSTPGKLGEPVTSRITIDTLDASDTDQQLEAKTAIRLAQEERHRLRELETDLIRERERERQHQRTLEESRLIAASKVAAVTSAAAAATLALEAERERERERLDRERIVAHETELALELRRAEERERRRKEEDELQAEEERLRYERKQRLKRERRRLEEEEEAAAAEMASRRRAKSMSRSKQESRTRTRGAHSPTLSTRENGHRTHATQMEARLDVAHQLAHQQAEVTKLTRQQSLLGGLISNGPGQGLRPYGQPLSSWSSYAYPTSSGLWPSVGAYTGGSGIGPSSVTAGSVFGVGYGPMPTVAGAQVYGANTTVPGVSATLPNSSSATATSGPTPSSSHPHHHSYIVDASTLGPLKPGDLIYDPVKQQYVQVEEEVQVHVAPTDGISTIPAATHHAPPQASSAHPVSSVSVLLNKLQSSVQQVQPNIWNP